MAHEGTHLNGNRYEGMAHLQGLETYNAINAKFGLEADGGFYSDMALAIMNPESWVENTGDVDNWTLTEDGKLINDGKGYLRDKNGKYINYDGSRSDEITDKTIGGDGGIETGLLNILFGETNNKSYDDFTDQQVRTAQILMKRAGIKIVSDPEIKDPREIAWSKANGKQELDMGIAMSLAGDTIVSQVFARYYDSTSNAVIAGRMKFDIGKVEERYVSYAAVSRYINLLNAKSDFYANAKDILDPAKSYYITTLFKEKAKPPRYETFGYLHYGLDLSRTPSSEGDPIYAGISGKVTSINRNPDNNGQNLQMEYGYNFEGGFIGTGIYGEYLHMQKAGRPDFKLGQYISSDIKIGTIGNTGASTGAHLHYDIFSINSVCSDTTLSMFYGESAKNASFASIGGGYKRVYDPALYYSNWLKKELLAKGEWLKKYGGN
jgi:murein DD-endopeptidase MepM/ murein hydrolase activator NlpD